MKSFPLFLFLIITTTVLVNSCSQIEKNEDLKSSLDNNWLSPENYIISKFKDHDYVFVGEFHRIKHDLELIKNTIPKLHENGVYNLGFEFASYELQLQLDSLLNMRKFDRVLARNIIFDVNPGFNYKDYIDVFEAAWTFNSSLKDGQKRFRIIGLTESYVKCKDGEALWQDLDTDAFMADVILKEIVSKDEKALIFMGVNHAVTKYPFPKYDIEKDSLLGYGKRTGNIVYDSIKDKSFTIYLHAAWHSLDFKKLVIPVHGKVDSVLDTYKNKRVGFDTKNTPFGKLSSSNTFYKYGNEPFTLDKFCDGYIYQTRFTESQSIQIEDNFYTENNIDEFKCFLRKVGVNEEIVNSLTIESANKLDEDNVEKFFKLLIE